MKRSIVGVIATLLCAALVGCSGFDTTQILVAPDTVAVSAQFDVAVVNLFTYVDTGTIISKKVERDSLHLLVGLPESWNILGARMVKVGDMEPEQMLALQSGSMDPLALAGMVQAYQAQAVDLAADNALATALEGQTVSARSVDASAQVDVAIDSVKQWKGFSAPVDVVLNQGDKPDTIVPLDSAVAFALASGMLPDSVATTMAGLKSNPLIKVPDTIGISVVPIAVFLKIQASSTEKNDTLYFFSKTDSMNSKPSPAIAAIATLSKLPWLAQMESGDMTFASITVSSTAAVSRMAAKFSGSEARVIADRAAGSVRISLGNFDPVRTSVNIYSTQGRLIKSLAPQSREVVWNGCNFREQKVPSGTYFVRLRDTAGDVVRSVQLIR